jgi:hypothetical protein
MHHSCAMLKIDAERTLTKTETVAPKCIGSNSARSSVDIIDRHGEGKNLSRCSVLE